MNFLCRQPRDRSPISWNSLLLNADKLTSEIFVYKLSIEHSIMCDSRTLLNCMILYIKYTKAKYYIIVYK